MLHCAVQQSLTLAANCAATTAIATESRIYLHVNKQHAFEGTKLKYVIELSVTVRLSLMQGCTKVMHLRPTEHSRAPAVA